jgi:iron complex outermembrane receptor protein
MLFCIAVVVGAAGADDDRLDVGTVQVTGDGLGGSSQPAPGTAPAMAPSQPPLEAAQPTSVIGPSYIKSAVVPSQSYDNIIKFSPSVANVDPTGAGLQQNFQETIRGFRYTQFNSTFDGLVLPGTISSFAPQTGAYFMAHSIDSVSVDRGPGTASQIGYATFGGTVASTLAQPSPTFQVNPYGTVGSWGLNLGGVRVDTGAIPQLNGTMGLLDMSNLQAKGYLSGTSTYRNNAYGRIEIPVSDNTVITFVGMYDYARTHTPYGATLGQIQSLGANYALNQDPKSQAYTGYNTDNYYSDFDYIGIKSSFGDGWGIDDKLYTVSYYHNGLSGLDPNGTKPNLFGTIYLNGVKTVVNNDVPGLGTHSDFRAWGNALRVSKDTDYGQLRFGLWTDYDAGSSYKYSLDFSAGNQPYATTASGTAFKSLYNTTLTTIQPYLEFAFKPLPDLTITPGVKFTYVHRGLDATIINSVPSTAPSGQDWSAVLPAIDAHYTIKPGWVAYAQVAEGFLAPPLNTLLVSGGNAPTSLKPQQTVNYQIGTTFRNDRVSLGLDAYYIQFQNYIATQTNNLGAIYSNNGSAVFSGIEAEGTVALTHGVSIYANATINDAYFNGSGFPVALAPRSTAAAGPVIDRNGFQASFLWKYVGPQYLMDGSGPNQHPSFPISGYNDADLSIGYTLKLPSMHDRSVNMRLNVLNVFNSHSLTGLFGTTSAGEALYATNPGRGVFFSISAGL